MKFSSRAALLLAAAGSVAALSGYATTTRYYDGRKGACGCGTDASGTDPGGPFQWCKGSGDFHTAAGSQALFDKGGSTWCGSECGQCYTLKSNGDSPDGRGGVKGKSITVMVTNLCPAAGNTQWCPAVGSTNQYGFEYHFDLMATGYDLEEVFGDNPVVYFETVPCPNQDYSQCYCSDHSS